jgi:YHS domain-containing protein
MKMMNLLFGVLLAVSFAACDKKATTTTTKTTTATAGAVADDATIPKLAAGTAAKCPVTGEDFKIKESTVQVTYAGKRYAFCCADCQPTFAKDPAKYAKN